MNGPIWTNFFFLSRLQASLSEIVFIYLCEYLSSNFRTFKGKDLVFDIVMVDEKVAEKG